MKYPQYSLIVLAVCCSLISHSSAGEKKAFDAIKQDTIGAVTDTSITVEHEKRVPSSIEDGKRVKGDTETVAHTFKVTPDTDIEVNGKKSTIKDLSEGMAVTVTPDGIDANTASIIIAHDAKDSEK